MRAAYDYYPYGLPWDRVGAPYDETMLGTELQTGEWGLEGLDLNYFAARYYDPILARWHAPDPLEQCHSPYISMLGDPANFIDPDGRAGIPFLQDFVGSSGGDFVRSMAGQGAFLYSMTQPLGSFGGTIGNIVSISGSLHSARSSMKTISQFSLKAGYSAGSSSYFNYTPDYEMPGYGKSFQSTNSGSFSPTTDPLPQPGYIWAVDVINATLTFLGTASSSTHTYIYTMGSALDENGTYDPSTSFATTVTDENGNVVSSAVFQRAFELGYYTSSNFSTVDYAEWLNSWADQSAAFEKLYEMSKTTVETAATVMEVGLTLGAGCFAKWSIKKFFKKKLVKEGAEKAAEQSVKSSVRLYSEATYKSFERQLANDGLKSILRTKASIQKRIAEHLDEMAVSKEKGGYTSSMERELRTFQSQLEAIDDLLKTIGTGFN